MKRSLCILGVLLAGTAAFGSVSYSGGTYIQTFDTLPISGTTNPWTNDVTLTGWYALQSLGAGGTARSGRDIGTWNPVLGSGGPFIRADAGTSTAGALYSYGSSGSTERALGSIGSGTPGDFIYALVLQNTTAGTIPTITVTYDGEQWRNGGNVDSHILDFDYTILSAAPTTADLAGGNTAGYVGFEATINGDGSTGNDKWAGTAPLGSPGPVDFLAPVSGTTAGALDGNAPANRVPGITGSTGVSWGPGQFLVLRWWDNNSIGSDHGLAIDNMSFTPEPTSLALLGLGVATMLRRRRA